MSRNQFILSCLAFALALYVCGELYFRYHRTGPTSPYSSYADFLRDHPGGEDPADTVFAATDTLSPTLPHSHDGSASSATVDGSSPALTAPSSRTPQERADAYNDGYDQGADGPFGANYKGKRDDAQYDVDYVDGYADSHYDSFWGKDGDPDW